MSSLSPPKLSARVMLASLSLVKHSVLPEAVYKHDILEYHMHLGSVWWQFFGWLIFNKDKHKIRGFFLLKTRNCQNLWHWLQFPWSKSLFFIFPIRRNLLVPRYDYCFHSHDVQHCSEVRFRFYYSIKVSDLPDLVSTWQ